MSRGRVIQADASFGVSLYHVGASSTLPRHLCSFQFARPRHPCGRVIAISSLPRGRVIHAAASLLAGHLLNFLCSFHFFASFLSNL
ncbi:uncharacterized protein DS421_19g667220 [Arachis hypogaea]|uniref:Uncharacterized protein n=1 Tax=Arachis hypogaea TaxID=3818 RepID=A0A6B9VEK2_ARAHY|nr:uncharacterized protein DS421_19g667220 [Arachis hypogaea]